MKKNEELNIDNNNFFIYNLLFNIKKNLKLILLLIVAIISLIIFFIIHNQRYNEDIDNISKLFININNKEYISNNIDNLSSKYNNINDKIQLKYIIMFKEASYYVKNNQYDKALKIYNDISDNVRYLDEFFQELLYLSIISTNINQFFFLKKNDPEKSSNKEYVIKLFTQYEDKFSLLKDYFLEAKLNFFFLLKDKNSFNNIINNMNKSFISDSMEERIEFLSNNKW